MSGLKAAGQSGWQTSEPPVTTESINPTEQLYLGQ